MRRIKIVVGLAALSASLVPQARADVIFSGSCSLSLAVTYSSKITMTPGFRSVEFEGGGTCITTSGNKSILFAGAGSTDASSCTDLSMLGTYAMDFSPAPAPPSSSGQWTYEGTIQNGLMLVTAPSPVFSGQAILSSANALTTCQSTGVKSAIYTGSMPFNDP